MMDSMARLGDGPDAEDQDDDDSVHEDDSADTNIFHMLSSRDGTSGGASPNADASNDPLGGTEDDGVIASNDDTPAPAEDLWLSGDDLTNMLGGGAGQDSLNGHGGDDALAGYDGDDSLDGGDGDDALNGGAGDDTLLGGLGADLLHAGADDDHLDGGDAADTLQGCEGDDSLIGGAGNDSLIGGEGSDQLAGGTGDDALDGGMGDDLLAGGAGSDTLDGGDGNDTIWGQSEAEHDDSADFLNGGAGDDSLMLGAGDYGNGGDGADSFHLLDIHPDDPPMQITDFNPQEDALVVMYDAATHPDPQLTMETTAAGTTLLLDGVPLASLQAIANLDLSSITLQAA
ncbi:calcium-binding protein [Cypionkella aquatica]|nr:calcium-binding protein [Cypionkella aquatica]